MAETFLARHLGGRVEPIGPDELAASAMRVLESDLEEVAVSG